MLLRITLNYEYQKKQTICDTITSTIYDKRYQKEEYLCFARIRFRHCQITLPLVERDCQSLKLTLRQNSLLKVPFAIKGLLGPAMKYTMLRSMKPLCLRSQRRYLLQKTASLLSVSSQLLHRINSGNSTTLPLW